MPKQFLTGYSVLFVRFFYRSYISRTIGGRRASVIPKFAVDAAKGVNHKVDKAGRALEQANGDYARKVSEHDNEMDDIAIMKRNINERFTAILKEEAASQNGTPKKNNNNKSQANGTPNGHANGNANGHANGHANGSIPNGLSTTNPKEEGLEYAEVVKRPDPESES